MTSDNCLWLLPRWEQSYWSPAGKAKQWLNPEWVAIPSYRPVHIVSDKMVHQQPRTWQMRYHALDGVAQRVWLYHQTGKTVYLRVASRLALHWIKTHPKHGNRPEGLVWHDHGSAIRLQCLLWLNDALKHQPIVTRQETQVLKASIRQHTALMMSPGFYNAGHNHGYFQSRAYTVASALLNHPADVKRGLKAQQLYIQQSITSEGIHKEHSAGYHHMMAQLVPETTALAQALGLSSQVETQLLPEIQAFDRQLAGADGLMVPYGDTMPQPMPYTAQYRCDVYPNSGYAVMQDGPIHLLMTNSLFSRIHKHADNLGFHLTAYGEAWLVDAGSPGYDRTPHRMYATSAWAHNTVLVDNTPFVLPKRPGPTMVMTTRLVDAPDACHVQATHGLYTTVLVQRALRYQHGTLTLNDDVIPQYPQALWRAKPRRIKQLFHIPADKILTAQSPTQWVIQSKRQPVKLIISLPVSARATVSSGQTTPYYLGWQYDGHGKSVPLQTLAITYNGYHDKVMNITMRFINQ